MTIQNYQQENLMCGFLKKYLPLFNITHKEWQKISDVIGL